MGDCNNMFVLLLVSKEGDLVFMRKGPLSDADKKSLSSRTEVQIRLLHVEIPDGLLRIATLRIASVCTR